MHEFLLSYTRRRKYIYELSYEYTVLNEKHQYIDYSYIFPPQISKDLGETVMKGKTLVVYFSAEGTTAAVAKAIATELIKNNKKSLRVTMGIRRLFVLFLIGMFLCSAATRSKVEMLFI